MSLPSKDKYDYGPKSFGLTVRTSFVDEGDKTIPGPGTHENVRMNQTNPPTWRMGNDTERNTFLDKFHFQYPPPNNYDPKFQTTHPQFPNFSIPQATQQHLEKHKDENNSLLYKPNYNVGKHKPPNFSMGYYQENDYSTPVPAPNEYNSMKDTQKSFFNRYFIPYQRTQHSFSVSNRPLPYGQQGRFPGATAYHIQNYKPPAIAYSIGKGDRPEVIVGKDAPGTFYEIMGNMSKINTAKTMAPFYPSGDIKKNDFPSPDKYTPIYLNSRKKILNFYSNRAPLQNKAVLKNPSPQKYNTQSGFYKRKSLSFTKDVRDHTHYNQNPGPGAHDVVIHLGTKSGVMGKKLKPDVKFITPGADQYQPKQDYTRQSSPRVINYYSNRVDFSKSLTGQKVGPGSYIIDKQTRAQLGKISKSLKFPKDSNKNPGPGSYDIQGGIGKLPQYYTGSKKITKQGFSTFTLQRWEKEKTMRMRMEEEERRKKEAEEQQRKNEESNNENTN